MARAKEVKLGTGSVFLNNFSREKAEKLTELLNKFHASYESGKDEDVVLDEAPHLEGLMSEKAIGVAYDKASNRQVAVTVVYNLETKEAKVDHVIACDGLRDAGNKFKMLASDLRFV